MPGRVTNADFQKSRWPSAVQRTCQDSKRPAAAVVIAVVVFVAAAGKDFHFSVHNNDKDSMHSHPYYILLCIIATEAKKTTCTCRPYRRHRVKFFQLSAKPVRNFVAGMGDGE